MNNMSSKDMLLTKIKNRFETKKNAKSKSNNEHTHTPY